MSVSGITFIVLLAGFNPRPPKRTLCLYIITVVSKGMIVSIHVLRRGRCVNFVLILFTVGVLCFNPHPPKRTLCLCTRIDVSAVLLVSIHVLRRGRCVSGYHSKATIAKAFQSTSSEEDVVSPSECHSQC